MGHVCSRNGTGCCKLHNDNLARAVSKAIVVLVIGRQTNCFTIDLLHIQNLRCQVARDYLLVLCEARVDFLENLGYLECPQPTVSNEYHSITL
jgi:hypothetical protein